VSDGDSDGDQEAEDIPRLETAFMVVSVLFTCSLFGFAVWQSLTGAGAAAPTVNVTGAQSVQDGVRYDVELRNDGDVGLVSATVRVGCVDPPTALTFENVPGGGSRRATVVCPAGTSDPAVAVVTWVEE